MVSAHSNLLIRVDAGPTVGTGHVLRTLALAQAWQQQGGQAAFACGPLPRGLSRRIEAEGFEFYSMKNTVGDIDDAQETLAVVDEIQPDWIVVDGPRFGGKYLSIISQSNAKIMIVDDHGHATHGVADLVLNQHVHASPQLYQDLGRGKVMAGPQYVLLPQHSSGFAMEPGDPKRIASEARRIMVSFGDDTENWTLKSLQVLSDLNRKRLVVDCVVGQHYAHVRELTMFKKTANMSLRIHRQLDRITNLIPRLDLAISAGGPDCYELARNGIPTIVASANEQQFAITQIMHERGAVQSIDSGCFDSSGNQKTSLDQRLKYAVRELINNAGQRRAMSIQAMKLVDGFGAHRIARTMAAGTFSIRPAVLTDLDTIWQWHNDPEVRSVSFDSRAIPYPEFRDKFQQQLNTPQTNIWIAENSSGQPIGQVCISTASDENLPVINVIVDQARRGRGLGTLLISHSCDEYFKTTEHDCLLAQIKPGNIASEKAFRAAGFAGIAPQIVQGKMATQFIRHQNPTANYGQPLTSLRRSA